MASISFDDTLNALYGKNYSEGIPYSFWKHFPGKDLAKNDLVKAHFDFQQQIESDLIKFSPNSKYCVLDFGLEIDNDFNSETGSYLTKKYPIESVTDWEKIDEIDALDGNLGIQLDALKKFSTKVEGSPIMMTIFLPMMVADKLVAEEQLIQHLKTEKSLVKDRLKVIEKVMTNFSLACLDEGSDGLFLATQHTQQSESWGAKDWIEYVYPIDNQLIKNLKTKAMFTVLHLHGPNIFFKEVLDRFRVTAINWHHFDGLPTGIQDQKKTKLGLIDGFEEAILMGEMIEEEMKKVLDDVITQFKDHLPQLIIGPGCVLPQKASLETLKSFVKKIKERKMVIK